jgi:ribonuclease Z
MKLVLLGTAGYHPSERRHTACLLLPEVGVVLDAGTGLFRLRERLVTSTLDLFVTHAHLDHVVGLTYLLGVLYERPMERVTIHGQAEKLDAIRAHLFAEALFPVAPTAEFRPLSGAVALPGGGRLTHFPLVHPGGAVGFRLDWPASSRDLAHSLDAGHSLAYVTDTTAAADADYVERIRGVDLLIHECNFPDDKRDFALLTGHSHTTAVAQVAARAGVGRLVLVHFDPYDARPDPVGLAAARAVFPATELGVDLMEIEF